MIRELTRHVGSPSITQQILIRRSARLLIMVGQLERRLIEQNDIGDLASRQICALHNSLRLSLQALGFERGDMQLPDPIAYLASRKGEAA